MTFVRTNSGLSNFHAFFGVEYIVYSEGGDPKKSKRLIIPTIQRMMKYGLSTLFSGVVHSQNSYQELQ